MQDGINNNTKYVFNTNHNSYTHMYYSNSQAKTSLEKWYNDNIGSNINLSSKVASGNYYCEQAKVKQLENYTSGNTNMTVYSSYTLDFKCNSDGNGYGVVNVSVGLLSYEEVVYAGGYVNQQNSEYYLYNASINWWVMGPAGFLASSLIPYVWNVRTTGILGNYDVNRSSIVRPVINLTADTQTSSGNGTKDNPFVVE